MHMPITRRIRSIVDESLVHCHRGCAFEPCVLCVFLRFYIFINLIIYLKILFIIVSKPFGLLNIALKTANNAYPIELMHSVASRVCVFVFDNVPFDVHFVYMLKLFSIMLKG